MRLLRVRRITQVIYVLIVLAGCENSGEKEQGFSQVTTNISSCTKCPMIASNQDTADFVIEVRRFIAKVGNTGMLEHDLTRSIHNTGNGLDIDRCLEIFYHDSGTATCGLMAQLMVEILLENGIDAYAFSFGYGDIDLAHEVVLVKIGSKLYFHDPFQNYSITDINGEPLDLLTLVGQIGANSLRYSVSQDTVSATMLLDQSLLRKNPTLKAALENPTCVSNWRMKGFIRDSILKAEIDRCFGCDQTAAQCPDHFAKRLLDHLKENTGFKDYHEAIVINPVIFGGAPDREDIEDVILTAIYSQPDLGKRVNNIR